MAGARRHHPPPDRHGYRHLGTTTHSRTAAHRSAAATSGLPHLHLRFHRHPQGRRHRPCPGRAPVACHPRVRRTDRPGCLDPVPFLRVRLLRLGTVGRAGPRRTPGRGVAGHRTRSRCLPYPAVRAARQRAQPDPQCVPGADRCATAQRPASPSAPGDLRRRSLATGQPDRVVRRTWSAHHPAQHVRHHRDHRARHRPCTHRAGCTASWQQPDRRTAGGSARVCAGTRWSVPAGRCGR